MALFHVLVTRATCSCQLVENPKVVRSEECDGIKLRRGEKRVLNAVNKALGQEALHRCLVDPARQGRALERISGGPEKVFLLVRPQAAMQGCPDADCAAAQPFRVGASMAQSTLLCASSGTERLASTCFHCCLRLATPDPVWHLN